MYTHILIYICKYIYIYIYVYVYIYVYMYIYNTNAYLYMYVYIYIYTRMFTYTYIDIYTYAHMQHDHLLCDTTRLYSFRKGDNIHNFKKKITKNLQISSHLPHDLPIFWEKAAKNPFCL